MTNRERATTERPWRVFAHREPLVMRGTPESHEEELALSAAGYRGMESFETEEDAKRAAVGLRNRLGAAAPEFGWRVVWFGPETITEANKRDLGRCQAMSWVRRDR